MILDQDAVPQKLTSANSVNSIINHVSSEREQGGRVVGWAISFHRLLTDNIGIAVFTVRQAFINQFCDFRISNWCISLIEYFEG